MSIIFFNEGVNKVSKYLITTVVVLFAIYYFIYSTPTWVLSYFISKYSDQNFAISNQSGTFWQGSGLLVINNPALKGAIPVMDINWHITLGLKKLISVHLSSFNNTIAVVTVDKNGLHLNDLSLTVSLSQTSYLLAALHSLDLAGTVNITSSDGINIGRHGGMEGTINANLYHLSSTISPLNPIGDYSATMNLKSGVIIVKTINDAIIKIDGEGSIRGLTLNASVQPDKKDKLLQFMVMFGDQVGDNQYKLKLI